MGRWQGCSGPGSRQGTQGRRAWREPGSRRHCSAGTAWVSGPQGWNSHSRPHAGPGWGCREPQIQTLPGAGPCWGFQGWLSRCHGDQRPGCLGGPQGAGPDWGFQELWPHCHGGLKPGGPRDAGPGWGFPEWSLHCSGGWRPCYHGNQFLLDPSPGGGSNWDYQGQPHWR